MLVCTGSKYVNNQLKGLQIEIRSLGLNDQQAQAILGEISDLWRSNQSDFDTESCSRFFDVLQKIFSSQKDRRIHAGLQEATYDVFLMAKGVLRLFEEHITEASLASILKLIHACAVLKVEEVSGLSFALKEQFVSIIVANIKNMKIATNSSLLWAIDQLNLDDPDLWNALYVNLNLRDFTGAPHEAANILGVLGRRKCTIESLVRKMINSLVCDVDQLSLRELLLVLWTMVRTRCDNQEMIGALCAQLKKPDCASKINPRGLCRILWAMSVLNFPDEDLLKLVCEEAQRKIAAFQTYELVNLTNNLASLDHRDELLLKAVYKSIKGSINKFVAHDVARIISALGKLKCADQVLVDDLAQRAALLATTTPAFQTHYLCLAVQGLTELNFEGEELMILVKEVIQRGESEVLCAKDIAIVFWALGQRHCQDKKLLGSVCVLGCNCSNYTDTDLLRIFVALGNCRYYHSGLLKILTEMVIEAPQEHNAKVLVSCLWVNAQCGCEYLFSDEKARMLRKICDALSDKEDDLEIDEVVLLFWSLGMMNYSPRMLMSKLSNIVMVSGEQIKAPGQADILSSMGKINYFNSELFLTLCERVEKQLDKLTQNKRVSILGAMARLNFRVDSLVANLISTIRRMKGELSSGDLAEFCWALAILSNDEEYQDLIREYCQEAERRVTENAHAFSDWESKKLHAAMYAQLITFPPMLTQTIGAALDRDLSNPPQIQSNEQAIGDKLAARGYPVRFQVYCHSYWIDLVIEMNGKRVALELDGDPSHFVNKDPRLGHRGRTRLRDQVLKRAGYRVIHVVTHSLDPSHLWGNVTSAIGSCR